LDLRLVDVIKVVGEGRVQAAQKRGPQMDIDLWEDWL
jgi:hypothetical protein